LLTGRARFGDFFTNILLNKVATASALPPDLIFHGSLLFLKILLPLGVSHDPFLIIYFIMGHSINLWNFKPWSITTALLLHAATDYPHQGKQTGIEDVSSTLTILLTAKALFLIFDLAENAGYEKITINPRSWR
jgi:hypothetical protein